MGDFKTRGPKAKSKEEVDRGESYINEDRLRKVLEGDAKELNEYAEELAKFYLNGKQLSTSQIRNVLDEIQRMREFDEDRLHLLRPKLAYAAGRHGGRVKDFQKLLDKTIQMTIKDNYQNFKNFVEAIVAYHRYHGGK